MSEEVVEGGWIKLHRKIVEWEWYADTATRSVFIHLLLTAEFEPRVWRGVLIERGQALTTVAELSAILKLTPQQTKRALKNNQNSKQITIKTTNKNSLITIVNYDTYQGVNSENNKQNNKQTTNETSLKEQTNQQASYKERREEGKKEEEERREEGIISSSGIRIPDPEIISVEHESPCSTHVSGGDDEEEKPKKKKPVKRVKPVPTAEGIAFAEFFRATLPPERDTTAADLENWAIAFDELRRLDGRSAEEIRDVCLWARASQFWKSNFLSATKLRNKDKSGTKYYDLFLQRMKHEGIISAGPQFNTAQRILNPTDDYIRQQREENQRLADEFRRNRLGNGTLFLPDDGEGDNSAAKPQGILHDAS